MRDKSFPPSIETGLYINWKGDKYVVTGIILDVSNRAGEDTWKVKYRDEPQKFIGGVAVEYCRCYSEFFDWVPDPLNLNRSVPRFMKTNPNEEPI